MSRKPRQQGVFQQYRRKADRRPKFEIDGSRVLEGSAFTVTPSTGLIPKSHYRCRDLALLA
jgi:hypothetical protein